MMRTRTGFARLLPLLALTGLAAGTIALLASARPVQAPVRAGSLDAWVLDRHACSCSEEPNPAPAHNLRDAHGRLWELAGLLGQEVVGLKVAKARWPGADLCHALFVGCDFRGCDLRCATLRDARLIDCDLSGCNLCSADVREVSFERCNVSGAVLAHADLSGSDFAWASFAGADLRGANLGDAHVKWPINPSNVIGAVYDRFTRWPAGFDPRAHGARLVE